MKHVAPAPIVFIYGTACAGKSCICDELQKVAPEFELISIDGCCHEFLAKCVRDVMPEAYQELRRYANLDQLFQVLLKDSFDDIEELVRDRVRELARAIKANEKEICSKNDIPFLFNLGEIYLMPQLADFMFETVVDRARSGKAVLVDTVDVPNFCAFVDRIGYEGEVIYAFTHCPLSKLLERALMRNKMAIESGRLRNMRPPLLPMMQFVERVARKGDGVAHDSKDEVERLLGCEIYGTYLRAWQANEEYLYRDLDIRPSLGKVMGDVTKNLNINPLDMSGEVLLVPRYRYDVICDTGRNSSKVLASQIYDKLAERQVSEPEDPVSNAEPSEVGCFARP
jgi:hypothetical protein